MGPEGALYASLSIKISGICRNADQKYYLVDSSKIGKKSLNIQADLNEFDKCFFAGPKLESQFLSRVQKKKINYEFFKVKN